MKKKFDKNIYDPVSCEDLQRLETNIKIQSFNEKNF